ncbi:hypothetical protein [Sulfuricurvum sp.]|uniref:hypothetical protein n=1 Tax=Sulfuricurvum sp. TaxID=2025608 RepID=UPI0026171B58|nr:hypothetical protein [Sulfuricurvum sp.]MDD2779998.1 hypothetical protein [Sulfuricurvum sp.]
MLLTIDIRESAYDKVLYFLNNLKGDVEIVKRDYTEPTKEEIIDHIKEALQEVKLIQEGQLPSQGSLQNLIDELKHAN